MRFSTLAVVTAFAVSAGAADVKKRVRRADMRKEILQRRVRAEAEDVAIEDAMSMPDGAAPEKQQPEDGRPHHKFPDMASLEEVMPTDWTGDGHGSAECSTKVIDDFESGELDLFWNTEVINNNDEIITVTDPPDGKWKVVRASDSEVADEGGCAPGSNFCAQAGYLGANRSRPAWSYLERAVKFEQDVILEFNLYCFTSNDGRGRGNCDFYLYEGTEDTQPRLTRFNEAAADETEIDWDHPIAHYQVVLPPGTYLMGWEVGKSLESVMRVDNIRYTPLHCKEDTKTPTQRPSDNGHWTGDEHSDGGSSWSGDEHKPSKPSGFWGYVFGH